MVKLVFIVYRNPELTKEEFTHERTFVDHARSRAFFTEEQTIIAGVPAAV